MKHSLTQTKKPVTGKTLNVMLTIVTAFGLLLTALEILTAVFIQKDTARDNTSGMLGDDSNITTSEPWISGLVISLILLLVAYFVLLIICFNKSIKFRKSGVGKAVASLTTFAFVFGLLQFLTVIIALFIFVFYFILVFVTFGLITINGDSWNKMTSMIAIVIYVGVGFMVVSFLTSMSAMIVG
jgi:preprotein translocase subunit SecG